MTELSEVTAAVLAGGLGTRLRSVLDSLPKALARVNGKAFIEFILDQIADAGIKKVVLCTGYLGHLIQSHFGNYYRSLKIHYSQESVVLGTGGALCLALPYLTSEVILVSNCDSYCSADLSEFWSWHSKKQAAASVLLKKTADTSRYGRVNTGPDDDILVFKEKSGGTEPGLINAGVYLIRQRLLAEIPKNEVLSLERDIFPSWLNKGFYGYQTSAEFIDIGTPASYSMAETFFVNLGTTNMVKNRHVILPKD